MARITEIESPRKRGLRAPQPPRPRPGLLTPFSMAGLELPNRTGHVFAALAPEPAPRGKQAFGRIFAR